MGAYENFLKEEGSRQDLINALEEEWLRVQHLRDRIRELEKQILYYEENYIKKVVS